MDKKLPEIFQNKIDKNLNNNNKCYYSSLDRNEENINPDRKDINKKINEIFASPSYIYKANVEIKTKDQIYKTRIIGRNKSFLITMDNKTIPISEIIDIKKNSQA